MDGGWVRHAIAEAPSKQVSCGRGGQNMGSGRCGGETLYQDQPRGSIAGRTRPAGATVVRKWDEEQHAAPSHLFFRFAPHYSSIRCDDESPQDTIKTIACLRTRGASNMRPRSGKSVGKTGCECLAIREFHTRTQRNFRSMVRDEWRGWCADCGPRWCIHFHSSGRGACSGNSVSGRRRGMQE